MSRVLGFISPDEWQQDPPDLNPVDYRVWNISPKKIYRIEITNVDQLKQFLLQEWSQLNHKHISEAFGQWCQYECIKARRTFGHCTHNE